MQTFNMSININCPNCHEDLGKDTENYKKVYCSNCGEDNIDNPRGENN